MAKGDADISFWKRLIFKANCWFWGGVNDPNSPGVGSTYHCESHFFGLGSGMQSFTSNFNIACCLQVANSSLSWLTWEGLNMDLIVVPVSALKSSRNSESHREFPRNLRRSKGKRSSSLAFCRSMAFGLKFTI